MRLILIRHGITDWNIEKRIQGRVDRPLSDAGIVQMSTHRLPEEFKTINWYCSPLQRAQCSAKLLDIKSYCIEPALQEMDWGDWEGEVLKPLRKRLGAPMRLNEARGIDFCPPHGESPRQVQRRLSIWLNSVAKQQADVGAVVHKGIIRCIYAMATGWNMTGESPLEFNWQQAHIFEFSKNGKLMNRHQTLSLQSIAQ